MRIAIIGAGISGLIAEGALLKVFGGDIAVIDTKPEKGLSKGHKAVMRLRGDGIKEYVNCRLRKIKVQKGIFHEGKVYTSPNLLLNNRYSLKAYGSLGNRSLLSLGTVERYTISNIQSKRTNYLQKEVKSIDGESGISFGDGTNYQYNICISTIPMPEMIRITGIDYGIEFKHKPIFITSAKLKIESNVHQTLYFTDSRSFMPYRVTIEGDRVIAESMKGTTELTFEHCLEAFGLTNDHIHLETVEENKQEFGKIEPIDDDLRRKIMMDLTDEFNVYSFGRFATWKSLRIDQTLEDIKKILMFIRVKHKAYYVNYID